MLEKQASAFATLLVALFVSAPASAQSRDRQRFSWTRESGVDACIGEEDLHRKVVGLMHRDPFVDSSGPVVSGVVRREGDTLVATLTSQRPSEAPVHREFRADDTHCGPLADAVALAIVLSVEGAAPPMQEREPTLASLPVSPAAEHRTETTRAPRETLSAHAQAQWTVGILPQPTTGVGLGLSYKVAERVALAGGGLWLPPSSQQGQFSVGLAAARIGGCVETVRAAPVALVNCAYGLAGAMNVQKEAGYIADTGGHPWFAGSLTTAIRARIADTWVAEAGAEGAIPLSRPTYVTTTCPTVGFQQPVATLGIFLSMGMFFL